MRKGGFANPPLQQMFPMQYLPRSVPKEQAKPHVPEYVYHTSESFMQCPTCGKYYWKGTHPEKLRKKLMEIL